MIFQSGASAPKALRNFEKSSNLAKNEKKPCSTCIPPISPWYSGYPNIGYWVLIPLLVTAFVKRVVTSPVSYTHLTLPTILLV